MTERHAAVDGIRMRWLEQGAGPAVVLLHGIPTSPELWREVMPRVHGARVLGWEMVGYGESMAAGAERDIAVARQAEYLIAWLDALGIDRAVLVGHDLGGGVAQIAAVRHRERVAGLVLTHAVAYDSWPVPSVKALRALGGVIRRLPSRIMPWLLRPLFVLGHDDRSVGSASASIHLPRYARPGGADAFVRQIRSLDVHDTLAVQHALPELDLPAAVVWGDADGFQEIEYGERLARDLGAPLRRIPGGKHFTPEDHPEELALAVRGVLASV